MLGACFVYKLIEPKLEDEDTKRREFILNVFLLGSLVLAAVALVIVQVDLIRLGAAYRGASPIIPLITFLIFLVLYLLSRIGFCVVSAYILIGIYFISATYTAYRWGIEIPQGLLIYALIIVMSGVLISTRFAFVVTLITSFAIMLLHYLQTRLITHPNLYWKTEMIDISDLILVVVTLGVVMIVTWLSDREIEKSLRRARTSEEALKKERDLLEVKVEERTKELKKVQAEKVLQLYRFAEFGRLASGFLHDLTDPLAAVSFGTRRIEKFIQAARRQVQEQETHAVFSLPDEIDQATQILSHKAQEAGVEINFILYRASRTGSSAKSSKTDLIQTYGNPVKFNQLITNLISNAIDAYEAVRQGKRKEKCQVLVELHEKINTACLIIQDWGIGIPQKQIDKIFDPFFTTKSPDEGTGIGLSMCKDIVEKDFNGSIRVESKEGEGTTFIVEFPIRQENQESKD